MTGEIIYLRNAGANVNGLVRSIERILEDGNIPQIACMERGESGWLDKNHSTRIGIYPHQDCGAMGVVQKARDGAKFDERIGETLVSQFANGSYHTREELESFNAELQHKNLVAKAHGEPVEVKLVDKQTIADGRGKEHGKHLVISKPTSTKPGELLNQTGETLGRKFDESITYVVQAYWIDEVFPDIRIAIENLNIRDVVLVANGSEEYRQVNSDLERLRLLKFVDPASGKEISDLKISVVRLADKTRSRA